MSEIESKIKAKTVKGQRYAFLMQDGETWISQFANNKNIPEELKEALKNAEKGETWRFQYEVESGFKNITAMERIVDVNEDVETTPPAKDKSYRESTSLFQTKLNGAVNMWVAMVTQGNKLSVEDLDIYYQKLDDMEKDKLK